MAIDGFCQVVPKEPSDYFTAKEWTTVTQTLRRIESDVCKAAGNFGLIVHSSSRWPSLSIVRRRAFKRRSVTLRLASNYIPGNEVSWELAAEEITHAWVFFYRQNEHRTVASFPDNESSRLVIESVRQLAERYLVDWKSGSSDGR